MVGMVNESPMATVVREPCRFSISRPAWYQTDFYTGSGDVTRLRIREDHLARARAVLESKGLDRTRTAFVHIRAGDYRYWPSVDAPAILSAEWYRLQVSRLRQFDSKLAVIGVGDDSDYVQEVMSGIPHAFTVQESYSTEFALMSLCSSGVLSASSFAYWAAVFARREFPDGVFIAPRFWAGHAMNNWYPPNIETASLTYVEVGS
jgi:hypothetical protein